MTINSILEEIINLAKKYSATSNDINTIEGGTHLAGFRRGLTRTLKKYAEDSKLLEKDHLPEYKQKSKAFVQKKLVEKLPEMILNEQISQKLFERDYTQIAEEIRNYKKENSRVRCQEKVTYTFS